MLAFEKHLVSSLTTILGSKMYFWSRRSVWRYLFASVLISIVNPNICGSFILTTLAIFGLLVIFSLLVIFFSSKSMAKKELFDADVEFSQNSIVIKHRKNHNNVEAKNWDWVKAIKVTSELVTLELNERKNKLLIISTSKLNEDEINFFRAKMKELKVKK